MDVLGILGIVLTLAIAYWEHSKAKKAEERLDALARHLPGQLLSGVSDVLRKHMPTPEHVSDGWSPPAGSPDQTPPLRMRYADLNGDGQAELLIEFTGGAHSSTLLVYAFVDWDLQKIAELSSSTPFGFELIDTDGDGAMEVETVEVAERPQLPYACGLRDRVTHKLVNGTFAEVARIECWDQDDVDRIKNESGP